MKTQVRLIKNTLSVFFSYANFNFDKITLFARFSCDLGLSNLLKQNKYVNLICLSHAQLSSPKIKHTSKTNKKGTHSY